MKTLLAVAALTATASASFISAAHAAPASAPVTAQSAAMDFMGQEVNYEAAARAETMAIPTHDFHISTHFGDSGSHWSSGHHTGLDFAAASGTNVEAADAGKVVVAGPGGAYGNMIEIAHGDGTRTRYAHLSDIDVKVGQHVGRDEHIGDVGTTGNSTGPHLHFEVLVHGKQVDPENFVNI